MTPTIVISRQGTIRQNQTRRVIRNQGGEQMTMKQFSTKQLGQAVKGLEHAKANRPGGLLVTEQAALDNIKAEIHRRKIDKEA
jgi:hypothetical protein